MGTRPVPRFPSRTLVLMILALASFAWFFWQTHARAERESAKAPRGSITEVQIVTPEVPRDH